jgi:hypothetical protein
LEGGRIAAIDGKLYVSINRHSDTGKDANGGWAYNGSVLMSRDKGRTWYNHHDGTCAACAVNVPPPLSSPMFPGNALPFLEFINYGPDGSVRGDVDGARRFVYAFSTDSEKPFDRLVRVKRDLIQQLRAKDWQYYTGDE